MSEEMKKCPFCGEEIKSEAKKCKHCGKWLEEEHAAEDSVEENSNNKEDVKKETSSKKEYCKNLLNKAKQGIPLKTTLMVTAIIAGICYIFTCIGNVNWAGTPSCDAAATKEQVINIFKENSDDYKDVDSTTIQNVELHTPIALSYDKNVDRYMCSAEIRMYANDEFKPKEYDWDKNSFYRTIARDYHWNDYLNKYVADSYEHYSSYKTTRFEYTAQKSEGKLVVLSSTFYDGKFDKK